MIDIDDEPYHAISAVIHTKILELNKVVVRWTDRYALGMDRWMYDRCYS